MCRLLGIYGKVDFWREMLSAFGELAETGKVPPVEGVLPGHKDGWGIAVSNKSRTAMEIAARDMGSAADSRLFRETVENLAPPHVLICHLRKASSPIAVTPANVHPFLSGGWAFIHNGFVSSADKLHRDASRPLTSENSDSEFLFHHLLASVSGLPDREGIFEALAGTCASLPQDYTSINHLMSDGGDLYCTRRHEKYNNYYTLFAYRLPQAVAVCSEPLACGPLDPENWREVPNGTTLRIHGDPPKIETSTDVDA